MESPEFLLSNLNRVVRELRGAIAYLEEADLAVQLDAVIKRLFLAELLAKEQVIAIGGSQGAGKTKLIRLMYDLHCTENSPETGWLPDNSGRGERTPVLVVEDDIEKPQGYLRMLVESSEQAGHVRIVERKADSEAAFRQAAAGQLDNVMLVVLKVPRRFFNHTGQGFMLMPGYEPIHEENRSWQILMRQALVACSGRIIVTDEVRLASGSQATIQADLQMSSLAGTEPLIIISKTEIHGDTPKKLDELRTSAARVFEIHSDRLDTQILCTGSSAASIEQWRPLLTKALPEIQNTNHASRERQLQQLEHLLSHDLNYAVVGIRGAFVSKAVAEDTVGHQTVQQALEVFDRARDSLRSEYKKALKNSLDEHYGIAKACMDGLLVANHEGFLNKVTGIFDTVTEKHVRLSKDLQAAWANPGSYLDTHIDVIGKITAKKLGAPQAFAKRLESGNGSTNTIVRLGYTDDQGHAAQWKNITPEILDNITVLFYPKRDDQGLSGKFSKEMTNAIKMLPAMTLEFARIGSLFPDVFQIDPDTLQPLDDEDATAAAKRIERDFSALQKVGSNVIKGIALMLAVDVAADGHVDTIPALFNSLGIGAGTAGMTLAGAATAMIAIGMLTYSVLKEVDRQDRYTRDHAIDVLKLFKEQYQAHYLEQFDILIEQVRTRMFESLTVRYRLDETIMRRDRVTKALADVTSLRLDLQDEIGVNRNTSLFV
ncbi:hypothetical protein NJC38_06570 [Pseudomonas sp. 21LCFQ010]|uniref:hypothetical protein n=1 Tax=Pseudomonas sp. 21LCFQ010 TaxID=2957506 RepID=UPI0020983F49|nr:hypothetical protein [Pseudomonas sp. 21LCFQ010]MCO8161819.1 hypothetical protein [Pseudomonas sp. 21LCFQ010]